MEPVQTGCCSGRSVSIGQRGTKTADGAMLRETGELQKALRVTNHLAAALVCDVLDKRGTMARRKKDDGWFELFLWLFTKYSAWLCIPVAIVVFAAINVGVLAVTSRHAVLKGIAQLGPMAGGLAALLALGAGVVAGMGKRRRGKIYDQQTSIESIRTLSWSAFELLIGEAYRRQGYEVIETGGGGADGGIDLKLNGQLETVLVQCKQWKVYKVGVKPIRELFGVLIAERADRAIFVTSGVYTREAQEFANGKPMQLIDGAGLWELIEPVRHHPSGINHDGSPIPDVRDSPPLSRPSITGDAPTPECPVCRGAMVLRTARRGNSIGSQFWGCSAYPQCRGTLPLAKLVDRPSEIAAATTRGDPACARHRE